MALDMFTVGAGLLGGLMGSQGTTQQSNQLDPRLANYLYGGDGKTGLLPDMSNVYQQQMAQGGLNDVQRAGINQNLSLYQSPFAQNGFNALTDIVNKYMGRNGSAQVPYFQLGQQGPVQLQQPQAQPRQMMGTPNSTPAPQGAPQGASPMGSGQGFSGQMGLMGAAPSVMSLFGGGGNSAAPGGQGINNTVADKALAAMSASQNPALRVLSPAIAALLGVGGSAVAGRQADAMGEAGNKLAASQPMANLGMGTVSDENGNVRTYSTPESIAAADALAFGVGPSWDDAAATREAMLQEARQRGQSGSGGGRFGTFGRNNMAGDASGMGFGGQSGFGGSGFA